MILAIGYRVRPNVGMHFRNRASTILEELRNYLQVGFYTEVLFREKGVRFIAISNGVDSTQQSTNEFAPFLNIMNEWYVRDTSRKIKSVLHAKGMEGNEPMQVARILTNEKVERPSYYLAKQELGTCQGSCDMSRPYTWTATTISDMVKKPEYMGHTINFCTHKDKHSRIATALNIELTEFFIIDNTGKK